MLNFFNSRTISPRNKKQNTFYFSDGGEVPGGMTALQRKNARRNAARGVVTTPTPQPIQKPVSQPTFTPTPTPISNPLLRPNPSVKPAIPNDLTPGITRGVKKPITPSPTPVGSPNSGLSSMITPSSQPVKSPSLNTPLRPTTPPPSSVRTNPVAPPPSPPVSNPSPAPALNPSSAIPSVQPQPTIKPPVKSNVLKERRTLKYAPKNMLTDPEILDEMRKNWIEKQTEENEKKDPTSARNHYGIKYRTYQYDPLELTKKGSYRQRTRLALMDNPEEEQYDKDFNSQKKEYDKRSWWSRLGGDLRHNDIGEITENNGKDIGIKFESPFSGLLIPGLAGLGGLIGSYGGGMGGAIGTNLGGKLGQLAGGWADEKVNDVVLKDSNQIFNLKKTRGLMNQLDKEKYDEARRAERRKERLETAARFGLEDKLDDIFREAEDEELATPMGKRLLNMAIDGSEYAPLFRRRNMEEFTGKGSYLGYLPKGKRGGTDTYRINWKAKTPEELFQIYDPATIVDLIKNETYAKGGHVKVRNKVVSPKIHRNRNSCTPQKMVRSSKTDNFRNYFK